MDHETKFLTMRTVMNWTDEEDKDSSQYYPILTACTVWRVAGIGVIEKYRLCTQDAIKKENHLKKKPVIEIAIRFHVFLISFENLTSHIIPFSKTTSKNETKWNKVRKERYSLLERK